MEQNWDEIRSNIEENRSHMKKNIKKLLHLNKQQFILDFYYYDLIDKYYSDIQYYAQKDNNLDDAKILCDFCEKITQFHNQKYFLKCSVPTIQQQRCIDMVLYRNEETIVNNFIHFKRSFSLFNECFLQIDEIEPESLTNLY